ncbi:hypothetical protein M5689_021881 [Euphorbia peplus]|nr:hypothetical protein M5689_021881 [Euphorbia peplus]
MHHLLHPISHRRICIIFFIPLLHLHMHHLLHPIAAANLPLNTTFIFAAVEFAVAAKGGACEGDRKEA